MSDNLITLSFSEEDFRGGVQYFAHASVLVGDQTVRLKYVVPPYFDGKKPDTKHLWKCQRGENIFVSNDGTLEIIGVSPQEKLAPCEPVLIFERGFHRSEEQWRCDRQENGRTTRFILDRRFDPDKIRPNIRWSCITTAILHQSDDGKFVLVAVMPKERQTGGTKHIPRRTAQNSRGFNTPRIHTPHEILGDRATA